MANHPCRPLRVERDDVLWFVTSRCLEQRHLLLPFMPHLEVHGRVARRTVASFERRSDRKLARVVARANAMRGKYQAKLTVPVAKRILKGLIGSAIARAQKHTGAQVIALVVMSNHLHLVVRTPQRNLANFMGYVKARITEGLNYVYGREGTAWGRRYDAQPILDDHAAIERVVYALANPVQANLVDTHDEWPGVSAAYGIRAESEMRFEYFDRTAWHAARRPDDVDQFFREIELELTPLPHLAHLMPDEYRWAVEPALREREQVCARERAARRNRVVGLERLADVEITDRPDNPKRSSRPYCHTSSAERRTAHHEAMRALTAVYLVRSEVFRFSDRGVEFPAGTYPPPICRAAA